MPSKLARLSPSLVTTTAFASVQEQEALNDVFDVGTGECRSELPKRVKLRFECIFCKRRLFPRSTPGRSCREWVTSGRRKHSRQQQQPPRESYYYDVEARVQLRLR